jgi:hypothetical protein
MNTRRVLTYAGHGSTALVIAVQPLSQRHVSQKRLQMHATDSRAPTLPQRRHSAQPVPNTEAPQAAMILEAKTKYVSDAKVLT